MKVGISPVGREAMINSGSSVFGQLPHGSLFHSSADFINMNIRERFKLIPYEIIAGLIMTVVSTIIHGLI